MPDLAAAAPKGAALAVPVHLLASESQEARARRGGRLARSVPSSSGPDTEERQMDREELKEQLREQRRGGERAQTPSRTSCPPRCSAEKAQGGLGGEKDGPMPPSAAMVGHRTRLMCRRRQHTRFVLFLNFRSNPVPALILLCANHDLEGRLCLFYAQLLLQSPS